MRLLEEVLSTFQLFNNFLVFRCWVFNIKSCFWHFNKELKPETSWHAWESLQSSNFIASRVILDLFRGCNLDGWYVVGLKKYISMILGSVWSTFVFWPRSRIDLYCTSRLYHPSYRKPLLFYTNWIVSFDFNWIAALSFRASTWRIYSNNYFNNTTNPLCNLLTLLSSNSDSFVFVDASLPQQIIGLKRNSSNKTWRQQSVVIFVNDELILQI